MAGALGVQVLCAGAFTLQQALAAVRS